MGGGGGGGTQAELSIVKLFEYFMNSRGISRENAHLNLCLLCHSTHQKAMRLLLQGSVVRIQNVHLHSLKSFFYEEGSSFKWVSNICIQISCHQSKIIYLFFLLHETHIYPD